MFLGTNRFLRSQNINLQLWEETTSIVEEITCVGDSAAPVDELTAPTKKLTLVGLQTRLACGDDDDNDDDSTHGRTDMEETEARRGG